MFAPDMLLSLLLLIPLAGVAAVALLPGASSKGAKWLFLIFTTATFLVSLLLLAGFDSASGEMQFTRDVAWFDAGGFHVHYHVGIDGISLFLVVLTTILMPIVALSSWNLNQRIRSYVFSMLLLEVGMIGVFIALDLVLFYLFWEVMLIPMYLLIGIWGGSRRIYAAVKFFIYTMAGSMMMLVAIITLYYFNGGSSFDLVEITRKLTDGQIAFGVSTERLLFLAFFLAFAIKVPLFPFHTWLPDAHVEAPTAGSVILAGVLLKMGTYGLLRFCLPLFPAASLYFAPLISVLAIVGIIYGALVAMVQPDIKKLVAYSSVSHLGFVVLGIFAFNITSVQGATLQMLNHGVSTGALFLLVGMIYERRHTRLIADFGGLAHSMPVFAALFMVVTLSSIGLPGLNGFVGEFLILQGTFLSNTTYAAFAASAMLLSAVYMLWMYQRVFLGHLADEKNRSLADLNLREVGLLVPLVVLALWIGLYSSSVLRPMDASVRKVVERVQEVRDAQSIRVDNRGN